MRKTLTVISTVVALTAPAQAHTHHRHHYRHHPTHLDPNGNSAYALIHTATGKTARVIASARDKFQGFINALEAEGAKIRDVGCLSSGHMPGSKHHWGGACDFDQRARNRTAGYMYHVTALAHRFGLTDGCEWHYRDCGHIEVPGTNSPRHNQYAVALR